MLWSGRSASVSARLRARFHCTTMAQPVTVSSLRYIKPRELSQQLLDPQTAEKIAIVDVRDSDYLGGHVKGCIHAPVDQLDVRIPELLRTLANKDKVVFHCMLSQQRGPSAALAYARAKAAADAKKAKSEASSAGDGGAAAAAADQKISGQQICVLEGGFQAWQKTIGGDARLTEGYMKEIWDAELF